MLNDLRHAWRSLVARPGFFATCVVTLGLGVGSVSAIFSVVHGTLLQPLPYPDAERIVRINRTQGQWGGPVSWAVIEDWRAGAGELITAIGAFTSATVNLTGEGDATRLSAYRVTPGFWDVMGMQPELGRHFTPAEDAAREKVVTLSHDFWRTRFGADPAVVGRDVILNGEPHRVVGVLPRVFTYLGSDVYLPTSIDVAAQPRGSNFLFTIARLAPAAGLAQFEAAIAATNARMAAEYPAVHAGLGADITPLPERVNGYVRQPLLILQGASALVLLIACANLANLLLARGAQREHELAVRAAIGASRGRLTRAMLAEALVIALAGAAFGLALAAVAVPLLLSLAPDVIPSHAAPGVDLVVVAMSMLVCVATVLLFALWPARKAAANAQAATLQEAGRAGGGRATARARSALVTVEVALSLALLVGAGLLIESMRQLGKVDGGVEPEHVLTAAFVLEGVPDVPGEALMDGYARYVAAMAPKMDLILERVAAIPGVRGVGLSDALPLSGVNNTSSDLRIVGRELPAGQPEPGATWRFVNPDFARTLGTGMVAGRHLDHTDFRPGSVPSTVLVNETFVRRYLADVDPIGQQVVFLDDTSKTIVGVVADTRGLGIDREPLAEVFMHHGYSFFRQMYLALKVDGDPMAYAGQLRAAMREIDPDLPVFEVRSMNDLVGGTVRLRSFNMTLMGVFSGVALALAALGLYGVVAYAVQQRRTEIGIRLALGAHQQRIAGMVLWQGTRLVALGLALGLACAYGLTRLLASQLYGVSPGDPLVIVAVIAVLAAVALVATLVPARSAAKIAPMEALRHE